MNGRRLLVPGTDLLRLDRLSADATYEEDGFLIVEASTHDPFYFRCCIFCDPVKLGTKKARFRDFPIQAQPVWLEVRRQRYRCKACSKVFYEHIEDIDDEARLTTRFREHLEREAVQRSFTDAANTNGVHETLIRRVFGIHAKRQLADYRVRLPRVLGMDEKYIQKRPRFVIGDVEARKMLDIRETRFQTDLFAYFEKMDGRENVEVVCQDMYKGYRSVVKKLFPRAVLVVDKFHVVSLGNIGVETVRRALNKELENKARVDLKRRNKLLLARWGTASATVRGSLERMFEAYPVLEQAYFIKERLYEVYDSPNRAAAERALNDWMESVPPEMRAAFQPAFSAIGNWRPFMLRYFEHRYTNAYVESLNGLVDEMNRVGRGYTFDVLRAKALLKYGNVQKLADLYAFDLMSISPEEREEILAVSLGDGVDISTFTEVLRAGSF